ncbi:NAD(+)/NADH kinase [Sulfobacillus harzensis]|uniref:NAD kinase n=1 Tax=Sulfobacillus harzensis TaxID=2729629 RepID=A0A7Y0L3D5_9FIRM|nr:NAD(+)/NADH kinase [Sulfobacillus harzensis]NMP21144.1 NAD(+)/NADH kinase [Sulfobacillus harzensis]
MPNMLVWPNPEKDQVRGLVLRMRQWMDQHDVQLVMPDELADAVGMPESGKYWEEISQMDLTATVVLGGDGTLLRAAKQLASLNTPILGVNLGHLGFLTEVEVPELYASLDAVLHGQFALDERRLLTARVIRDQQILAEFEAMNDVVVAKGPFARLINLETFVDAAYVTTYPADGIIIATPTGSTAYSLSAGGPILTPDLDVTVVTPICPHSFFDRSIVLSREQEVRIRIRSIHRDTLVTIDGQEVHPLEDGDEVVVVASPLSISLIRRPGWSFFHVLRGWRKGH